MRREGKGVWSQVTWSLGSLEGVIRSKMLLEVLLAVEILKNRSTKYLVKSVFRM